MNRVMCEGKPVTPSKIVCVGRNYVEHIQELNNDVPEQMVLFVKPNSAISSVLKSYHQEPLHYEAELCFMVADGGFAAVGVGLDLTKRQLQSELKAKGLPWERAKAFDGSALFSEFVSIASNRDKLSFTLHVDGTLRQQGDIGLMIHKPDAIYREISDFMTLNDGDIVMTGTPKGVGVINAKEVFTLQMQQGDCMRIESRWQAQ
ncbi:fumarylacetoacetate hydrolase family protein [Shewanella mesophila]|uniref:fumarylacetoacetate hydrolase family protein n=1 Tax=Shewanella mesophila TaxID=2864208 RepID=UPI003D9C9F99